MIPQLKNLHPLASLVLADKVEASLLHRLDELGVDFVTVTVPLLDDLGAAVQRAGPGPLGVLLEDGLAQTKAHRAAQVFPVELGHVDDHVVLGLGVELLRGCFLHAAHIPSELNGGHLEAKAHTQERNLVLPGPLGDQHHALRSAVAKATWHDDARCRRNLVPRLVVLGLGRSSLGRGFEILRVDPHKLEFAADAHGRVLERLNDGGISILAGDVFADKRNLDLLLVCRGDDQLPHFPEGIALGKHGRRDVDLIEAELGPELRDELLLAKEKRNLVNRRHVPHDEDLLRLDLAMKCQLCQGGLCERFLTPASNLGIH